MRMSRLEPQDNQVGGSAAVREGDSAPATPTQPGTRPLLFSKWRMMTSTLRTNCGSRPWRTGGRSYMWRMRFQRCCRWAGGSTWWRRMWIRSGHRAHGLDTYIYIYIGDHFWFSFCFSNNNIISLYIFTCKIFGSINFITRLCDFLVTPRPVYHVYVFVWRGGKIYPNKEGRVWNFQHESRTEVFCQTLYYPGKNHADMFSNALALLETFVCLFVCLFVCWNKTRKTILRLLLGGK